MSVKLMLVYQDEARCRLLREAADSTGYAVVACVSLAAELQQTLLDCAADIMVLDVERPDDTLLNRLHEVSRQHPLPVVMFARHGDRACISEAVSAGVISYVVDGLAPKRFAPIMEAASARFQAFQSLRRELHETKSKLEDRKHIDRAKGILMRQNSVTEEAAYQALRKLAMDRNIKIGEAACNVIAMAELFD